MRGTRKDVDDFLVAVYKSEGTMSTIECENYAKHIFAFYENGIIYGKKTELQKMLAVDVGELYWAFLFLERMFNEHQNREYINKSFLIRDCLIDLVLRAANIGIMLNQKDIEKYKDSKSAFIGDDNLYSCICVWYQDNKKDSEDTEKKKPGPKPLTLDNFCKDGKRELVSHVLQELIKETDEAYKVVACCGALENMGYINAYLPYSVISKVVTIKGFKESGYTKLKNSYSLNKRCNKREKIDKEVKEYKEKIKDIIEKKYPGSAQAPTEPPPHSAPGN